jgi:hypothetical protein
MFPDKISPSKTKYGISDYGSVSSFQNITIDKKYFNNIYSEKIEEKQNKQIYELHNFDPCSQLCCCDKDNSCLCYYFHNCSENIMKICVTQSLWCNDCIETCYDGVCDIGEMCCDCVKSCPSCVCHEEGINCWMLSSMLFLECIMCCIKC